jgi:UDP-N-acetylmuramoylalanine--D-glutamate ligase
VQVVGVDRRDDLDAGRLREAGVEVVLGADDPELLDGVDLLVKSPGVPPAAPLAAAARERGLTVWSEVELGFRLLANPILGVTGTNGKTTTSELLGAIFRAAGKDVAVAGNVGRASSSRTSTPSARTSPSCSISRRTTSTGTRPSTTTAPPSSESSRTRRRRTSPSSRAAST